MNQRVFTDQNGEQLIIRHRKSAVLFLRETDLNIKGYVSPFWKDPTPIVEPKEMKRTYTFSQEGFEEFSNYMEQIAQESWKNFTPKIADSLGADYEEYYDKEFDTEGSLHVGKHQLQIEGPYQPKTNDLIIRMYKFNKRKFESFIYDLKKTTET